MSFMWMSPATVDAVAGSLAGIHSDLDEANAAAAGATTGALAPAADGVSASVAAVFGSHAQEYQGLSAQMSAVHGEIVKLLNSSVAAYLGSEVANAQQAALTTVNAPAQALLGHPLIGNGGSPSA